MQSNAVHPLKFSPMRRKSKAKLRILNTQKLFPLAHTCLFPRGSISFVHFSVKELGPLLLE